MSAKHLFLGVLLITASSCSRNSESWENVKTAGRYMQRGIDALWGKEYESRMLASEDEFTGPYDEEFIPLSDSDLRSLMAKSDALTPQPKGIPGEQGVPSLDRFLAPAQDLRFSSIHFETDEHVPKDALDLQTLRTITAYLKAHPKAFLLVEGHTDERASAGYNMALGTRRANHIRTMLVNQGVDLNRIYATSRGKEQPIALGHSPEDWKHNRRVEFKLYEK